MVPKWRHQRHYDRGKPRYFVGTTLLQRNDGSGAKGIFSQDLFFVFAEVMVFSGLMMLTDIILLDLFKHLWHADLHNKSIVFQLLGR